MKNLTTEEVLAKITKMLPQLNQEGRERLLECGDVLTSCGKYQSDMARRIEWLRAIEEGGAQDDEV